MPCDSDVSKARRPTQLEALRKSLNLKHAHYSRRDGGSQYIYVDIINISSVEGGQTCDACMNRVEVREGEVTAGLHDTG